MKSFLSRLNVATAFVLAPLLLATATARAATPIELHAFPGSDFFPNGLVQGANGNFYGTMHQTGPGSYGGIFELSANGTVTNLVAFGGTNGADPKSRMILASDGNFYGVTEQGGANYVGTVFQLTQSGVLTTIAQFPSNSVNANTFFNDRVAPFGELIQGADGNLYGTTEAGGANNL